MFERFTEQARLVVVLAQEEARLMRHGHIGTEHLLVGVTRLEGDDAAAALGAHGLSVERTRAEVVRHVAVGSAPEGGAIPFTGAAKEALEVSLREALGLGHDAIRPGHILLAVLRQHDGVARRVLRDSGTDIDEVRRAVVASLQQAASGTGHEPSPRPVMEGGGGIQVQLGSELFGGLGAPGVDARLLLTLLGCNGPVAARLRERGIDEAEVRRWAGLD